MRVMITEAGSTVAYHLAALFAAGDVIPDQTLELVLCDRPERLEPVHGLVMELQDCVYPTLSGVQISSDMCETLKTVDLAVVLPPNTPHLSRDRCRQVQVSHAAVGQINFRSLNGAFHASGFNLQDIQKSTSHGPMSTAHTISQCVRDVCLKEAEQELINRLALHEEAEFGLCLDVPDGAGPSRLSLVFVSTTEERSSTDIETEYTLNCFVSRL